MVDVALARHGGREAGGGVDGVDDRGDEARGAGGFVRPMFSDSGGGHCYRRPS